MNTAKSFHDHRIARAALSSPSSTAMPVAAPALTIKRSHKPTDPLPGIGEGMTSWRFRPEGLSSRILGMGDIVGLMKDFEQVVDTPEG